MSEISSSDSTHEHIVNHSGSCHGTSYDVFLGGSCNPTTWRKNIAIPLLESWHLTYYNPQVSEWHPDLIKLENEAKVNSTVLLIVLNSEMRSTVTMLEIVYEAVTSKQKLVVVIQPQEFSFATKVENISFIECQYLKNAKKMLWHFLEEASVPVFDNITVALNYIKMAINKNKSAHKMALNEETCMSQGSILIRLKDAFISQDAHQCGKITIQQAIKILNNVRRHKVTEKQIKSLISLPGNNTDQEMMLSFEDLCSINAEICSKNRQSWRLWNSAIQLVRNPVCRGWASFRRHQYYKHLKANRVDVYLSDESNDSSWRNEVAIPFLKKYGLTCSEYGQENEFEGFLSHKISAMFKSQVKVFYITSKARGLVDILKLLPEAVKDYNRCRTYLIDIAQDASVPIFDHIDDALQLAVTLCQNS